MHRNNSKNDLPPNIVRAIEIRGLIKRPLLKKLIHNFKAFENLKAEEIVRIVGKNTLSEILDEIGIRIEVATKSNLRKMFDKFFTRIGIFNKKIEKPYISRDKKSICFFIRKEKKEADTIFLLEYFFTVLTSGKIESDIENRIHSQENIKRAKKFAADFVEILKTK